MYIKRIPLEKEALEVCINADKPPLIFNLPPNQGRAILDKMQDTPVFKYPADILKTKAKINDCGEIPLYFVCPKSSNAKLNTIFYIHGGGFVFGNFHTHEKLVRELAFRTNSVVVFPEYSLSPEAKFPVAINQCYKIISNLDKLLERVKINASLDKLTVAGDSAGGNIAIVISLMQNSQNCPKIDKQVLYYPVTNTNFNTNSYMKFAKHYYLYREGMIWFFNQYLKEKKQRGDILVSPLKASLEELENLPPTLIINGEADVLRDDGEAFAIKLRRAGVEVTMARFQAIIHDFVMLNSLDKTNACRGAMDLSTTYINRKNLI